jgi:hypothetical protein
MISITCTNCRTELRIDDAFAGGVCRCQHCGTIQTVPSHLKNSARVDNPTARAGASKALYQQKKAFSDAGTGLDDLANAIASSGLSSSRLRSATATSAKAAPAKTKNSPLLLLISGGVLLLAIIAAGVLYLVMHGPATATPPLTPAPSPDNSGGTVVVASGGGAPDNTPLGPSFCGVPLTDPSVVFILDRGDSTAQYFDSLKASVYRSVQLLGSTRQFAVILASNGTDDYAFPKHGMADADTARLDKLRGEMDDIVAIGASHLRGAIESAVARHPAVIVLVTAKWTLDQDDADALRQNAQRGIRFDTFILGGSDSTAPLQEAADRSGGTFIRLPEDQLKKFAGG